MLMFNYFKPKPPQNHISILRDSNFLCKIVALYVLIKSPFVFLDVKPLTAALVTHWNELVKILSCPLPLSHLPLLCEPVIFFMCF